ncbi:MAG: GNAT family N-acetyltransferase [Chitinophagales bacterium]
MVSLCFQPFPVLATERLLLRKISREDDDAFFALRSSKAVMRYIDRPLAKTKEDVITLIDMMVGLIESNEGLTWTITMKGEPGMIGTVHLWKISRENYRGEIGYLLDPAWQGQGIMREALGAVIHYGFESVHLHSFEANVSPENTASFHLLERCGFIREAHFRENFFYDGKFLDTLVFSLLTPKVSGSK